MKRVTKLEPSDIVGYDRKGRRITVQKLQVTKRNWGLFQIKGMHSRLLQLCQQFGYPHWRIDNEMKLLQDKIEKSVTPRTTGHKFKPFNREKAWQRKTKE